MTCLELFFNILQIVIDVLFLGILLPYLFYKLSIEEKSLKLYISEQIAVVIKLIWIDKEIINKFKNEYELTMEFGILFGTISNELSSIDRVLDRFNFITQFRKKKYIQLYNEITKVIERYEVLLTDNLLLKKNFPDLYNLELDEDVRTQETKELIKEFYDLRSNIKVYIPLIKSL